MMLTEITDLTPELPPLLTIWAVHKFDIMRDKHRLLIQFDQQRNCHWGV